MVGKVTRFINDCLRLMVNFNGEAQQRTQTLYFFRKLPTGYRFELVSISKLRHDLTFLDSIPALNFLNQLGNDLGILTGQVLLLRGIGNQVE